MARIYEDANIPALVLRSSAGSPSPPSNDPDDYKLYVDTTDTNYLLNLIDSSGTIYQIATNSSSPPTSAPDDAQYLIRVSNPLLPFAQVLGSLQTGMMHVTTGSGAVSSVKYNLTSAVNPTATDDVTQGYSKGSLWINAVDDKVFICESETAGSASWLELAGTISASGGGTGFTSYSTGDLLVGNTSSELSKLAVGSDNRVLIADSSVPLVGVKWGVVPPQGGGTGTSIGAVTSGMLLVGDGVLGSFVSLAAGAVGRVLKITSTNTPTWAVNQANKVYEIVPVAPAKTGWFSWEGSFTPSPIIDTFDNFTYIKLSIYSEDLTVDFFTARLRQPLTFSSFEIGFNTETEVPESIFASDTEFLPKSTPPFGVFIKTTDYVASEDYYYFIGINSVGDYFSGVRLGSGDYDGAYSRRLLHPSKEYYLRVEQTSSTTFDIKFSYEGLVYTTIGSWDISTVGTQTFERFIGYGFMNGDQFGNDLDIYVGASVKVFHMAVNT